MEFHRGEKFHPIPIQWKHVAAMYLNIKVTTIHFVPKWGHNTVLLAKMSTAASENLPYSQDLTWIQLLSWRPQWVFWLKKNIMVLMLF